MNILKWFSKQEPEKPDSHKEIVFCDKCKLLLYRYDARSKNFILPNQNRTLYFCPKHIPIWDEKIVYNHIGKPIPYYYINKVECDEEGNLIKNESNRKKLKGKIK